MSTRSVREQVHHDSVLDDIMSNHSVHEQSHLSPPLRRRVCSEKGGEFFMATALKNCNSSRNKVFSIARDIDDYLANSRLEDADKAVQSLVEAHDEFVRSHLRYQELLGEQTSEVEKQVAIANAEEVSTRMKNCLDRFSELATELKNQDMHLDRVNKECITQQQLDDHVSLCETGESKRETSGIELGKVNDANRHTIYNDINNNIETIIQLIERDDLDQADDIMHTIDGLFSEFMSCAVDSYINQDEEYAQKERDFTHQVDDAVFTIRKTLARAKSAKEVHHPTRSAFGSSPGQPPHHVIHPPGFSPLVDVMSKPPLPLKPKSVRSRHSDTRSNRNNTSHRPRSRSRESHSHHSRSHRSPSNSSTKSRGSSICSSSSTRERAIEEKVRLAALKAESRFLEQSQKHELEKKRFQMENERLEIEKEIAIAEAKSKVYDEHIKDASNSSDDGRSQASKTSRSSKLSESELCKRPPISDTSTAVPRETGDVEQTSSSNKLSKSEPGKRPTSNSLSKTSTSISCKMEDAHCQDIRHASSLTHLNDLCQLLKIQSAPDVDMDYFSGNPIEYRYFMSLFEELVEKKVEDPFGKLARLIKYTRGEAKELIQHCIQLPQPDGFNTAKDLLKREYGNSHKVTAAYMKELRSWGPIRAGDVVEFKRFHRFLLKCNTNRKGDSHLSLLDNPETLRSLQSKLPYKLQERWTRRAVSRREASGKELDFSDFFEFIDTECKVLDDPVYSQQAIADEKVKHMDKSRSAEKGWKENRRNESVFVAKVSEPKVEVCLYCSGDHDIDYCERFVLLSHKEKRSHLFNNKICFYCFGAFSPSEHGFNKCKDKRFCRTCNEPHPTALHKEEKVINGPVEETCLTTFAEDSEDAEDESSQGTVKMPIVAVRVHHKSSPEKSLLVYAMLDFCSSGTFFLERSLRELDIEPHPVSVRVRTMNGVKRHKTNYVHGLVLQGLNSGTLVPLPRTYLKDVLPVDHNEIMSAETIRQWHYLERVANQIRHPDLPQNPEQDKSIPIALIVGTNCVKAVTPLEIIPSQNSGPFAYRTHLGWCVAGTSQHPSRRSPGITCNRIQVKNISTNGTSSHQFVIKEHHEEVSIVGRLKEMYMTDFSENCSEKKAMSAEDRKFIQIMQGGGKRVNNHHQLPLPLREIEPELPDNKGMALKRLRSVRNRMHRDIEYKNDYINFMTSMISRGQAREVDLQKNVPKGWKWFIPHHGVYHPKTRKFRIVMDCSAQYNGRSLNNELLQGPDTTNLLLGVLLRFRQHAVPFMGDLEQMYYQIYVPENHRSLLRFLWWPDGDTSRDVVEYEMCVHLFGAISSPSVAGYALRKSAIDNIDTFGEAASTAVLKNFYVDDLCKSERTVPEAIEMISNIDGICTAGGFNLTKLISSNREVLESIPEKKRAKDFQQRDISKMSLPIERALGVIWCIESDTLGFRVQFSSKPCERRVILADVSSIYDPDGRGSAFLLPGKKILQELTAEKVGWDEPVSDEQRKRWNEWKTDMLNLENMSTLRCYTPDSFGTPVSQTLHCFSDASSIGYGQVSYLRSINTDGEVHVCQVMAKSRVAPLKSITIPRLELSAATVSVKVAALLSEELDFSSLEKVFWTDSSIVLGYISNETKRFKVYVANRLNIIQSYSAVNQWRHVTSEENPADFASRGLSPKCTEKVRVWFNGPDFLRKGEEEWPTKIVAAVDDDDEEVKTAPITINATVLSEQLDLITSLEGQFSSWHRLARMVALLLRFVGIILNRLKAKKNELQSRTTRNNKPAAIMEVRSGLLSVSDISYAEKKVIKLTQQKYMSSEFLVLSELQGGERGAKARGIRKLSSLSKLSPFINEDGLICVGGRLRNSRQDATQKHPIVIPKGSAISSLLIKEAHEKVAHCGRNSTLNQLRQDGFWIVGAHNAVRGFINKCWRCRELRGKLGEQKMADLPEERVTPSDPFTYCGADVFGPYLIKEGRKEVKRYGCIFTCMASRAVHIEIINHMCTDSLIQALRRFVARRGQVSSIHTDNGTNFVGAENELKKCLDELDHEKIQEFLLAKGCDWIVWKRNPPSSSHMGGVWERQIRSVRTILTGLMKEHATILNDESLRTFMAEAEAIINSRPLTVESINDSESPIPISPMQLLTLKSDVVFPPPGNFQRCDLYSRKRWRRVQFLANQFWHRWKVEYLASLQSRQKWGGKSRNFAAGDIVLVKDQEIFTKRNGWPMARIEEAFPSDDGLVRKVRLRVAHKQSDKTRSLVRPITKLVLLAGIDEMDEERKHRDN